MDTFVVVVPRRDIRALDVKFALEYARANRIILGPAMQAEPMSFPSCNHDERFEWGIDEDALHRFTTGTYIFYSDWCADLSDPHIDVGIMGTRGTHESTAAERAIKTHFGVYYSSRDETFVLP
jgi:hypothetical protein